MIRHPRGPFAKGDHVQLTDPKGRRHTVVLEPGKTFFTHRGSLSHDDLIGRPDGSVVTSSAGTPYVAFRPLLADFTLSMKRGAAVVYPKDAAQIVAMADVFPGARVVEAGAGSGALTCWLLRAVGDDGSVTSFERRVDFAEIARRNVEAFFGVVPARWHLIVGDFTVPPVTGAAPPVTGTVPPDAGTAPPDAGAAPPVTGAAPPVTGAAPPVTGAAPPVTGAAPPDAGGETAPPYMAVDTERAEGAPEAGGTGHPGCPPGADYADRVILDLLAPWDCVPAAARALVPGGVICCYVATTTQLSRTVEALRACGQFDEPAAWESLVRGWHVDGLAVRPDQRMVGHTGFLVSARRLADGVTPPPRRRRPAKGAHPDEEG